MRLKVTKKRVAELPPGAVIWDTDVGGFGVRRQSGDAATYVLKYRAPGGRQRWATIGRDGAPWTPETARAQAQRLLGVIASGGDPAAARDARLAAPTFADIARRFIAEHASTRLKPSTVREYRRLVETALIPALGGRPFAELGRADIARFHQSRSHSPTDANRALALLSAVLNWAADVGEWPDDAPNPCRRIKRFPEKARERFLSTVELARLGDALASWQGNPAAVAGIRLLLFTGARLGEVLGLRWAEIDAERGVARLPDSKTGAKTLHLPPPALAVLAELPRIKDCPFVLGGARGRTFIEKPWAVIRAAAGLADVHLHDLRHSFASVGAAGGLSLPMIGKMLGHTQAATTQRYAHLASDPVAAAAASVAARINAALGAGQQTGEVVALRPSRNTQ